MRVEFFLFVLFFSFFSTHYANPPSFTTIEGDASITINHSINPISGDYVISETDLIAPGYEPIYFHRTYLSSMQTGKDATWILLPHLYFHLEPSRDKKKPSYITITEPNGTSLRYKNSEKNHRIFLPELGTSAKGITNTSKGEISARTNLSNYCVTKEKGEDLYVLKTADGTKRYYKKADNINFGYLEKEKRPNGNWIFYKYDPDYCIIKEIYSTNPSGKKIYAKVNFTHQSLLTYYAKDFSIKTHAGDLISYVFDVHEKKDPKLLKRFFRLKNISSSFSPAETLIYKKIEGTKTYLITQRSIDNKVLAKMDYYKPGINQVGDQIVKIKDELDPIEKRIKTIQEPVGPNNELITTYRFFYNLGQFAKENKQLTGQLAHPIGHTYCFDVYNKKTEIAFNDFFVPLHTYKYGIDLSNPRDGTNALLFQEYFHWNFDGFVNRLQSKIYADQHHILSKRIFEYDKQGNILKETFIGNLSGHNTNPIPLNPREDDSSCDRFETFYTYDLNNNSTLSSQKFSSGLSYIYHYLEGTNLQKAKFTLDHGIIKLREFYLYNDDNVVITSIIDNGSSVDINDLTNVTERASKWITPSNNPSSLNFPYILEEKGWDKKTKSDLLLSKKIFHYSKEGLVLQEDIYDARNTFVYSLYKEYDDKHRLIKFTDPLGRASHLSYDSFNQVIKEKTPASAYTIDYIKNHLGKPLSIQSSHENSKTTSFTYDLKQRLIQSSDHLGNITDYVYDDLDHEIERTLPARLDEKGNLIRPKITTLCDVYGNPLQVTDSLGNKTSYTYNTYNKPTQILYPDQTKEFFFYYLDGTLCRHISQSGLISKYTYDFLGREVKKEVFTRDKQFFYSTSSIYSATHLLSHTDKNNVITVYSYDGFGRKISELKQKENVQLSYETYDYDSLGNLCKTALHSDSSSHQQIYIKKFDLAGRVIEEREEDENGTLFSKKSYTYDTFDHQIAIAYETDVGCFTEAFVYDNDHRLTKYTDREGKVFLNYYKDGSFSESLSISPDGSQIKERYNSIQELLTKEELSSSGVLLSKTDFFYDLRGNVIKETYSSFEDNNIKNTLVFIKTYDCFDRVILLQEQPGTSFAKRTQFFYDSRDNITKVIQPDDSELHYIYNSLGELISLKSSDSTINYSFSYDLLGHLIEEKDLTNNTSTRRTYDIKGNLTKEILANSLSIQTSYDGFGRKTSLLLPDRIAIDYDYDAFHLQKITRKGSSSQKEFSHHYLAYNLQHQPTKESLIYNLSETDNTYDALGRHSSTSSTYHSHAITSLNTSGAIEELLLKTPLKEFRQNYTYDDQSHLIKEEGFYHHCYGFDSHNNRLCKDDIPYENNLSNELLTAGSSSYSYSKSGSRSLKTQNNHSLTYHYDALHRLTKLQSESIEISFTYDSWHRRLSKSIYKKNFFGYWSLYDQEFYLYDGENEIGATNCSYHIKELKILGLGKGGDIGSAVAIELNGHLYVPLHDLFGNILALVDAEKKYIAESYLYSAFGESTLFNYYDFQIETSSLGNKWRYQSKRIDEESSLILFGRRYYDPSVGRWLSRDPLGLNENPNFYQFLLNSPLSYIDLYGLATEDRQEIDDLNTRPTTSVNPIYPFVSQDNPYATLPPWVTTPPGYTPNYSGFIPPQEIKRPFYTPYTSPQVHPNPPYRPSDNYRFFFINGINTSISEAHAMRNSCSRALGYSVDLFYNETRGMYRDLQQVSQHHKRRESAIVNEFRDCLAHEINHGKQVFIFAHSGGGLIAHNALEKLPSSYQKRINITTFGSAKYQYQGPGNTVQNFISKRDSISFGSNIWHILTNIKHPSLQNPLNVTIPFTHLDPHYFSPLKEHAFMEKTYQQALKQRCKFIKKNFSL